jgi:2-amino-4-hydroxy-6-hydroxymethyldihydropteridine diphosphokinase
MNKALLLAGTNIPPCIDNLKKAKDLLEELVTVNRSSSYYKSPAWGFSSQHDFVNQAFLIETSLSAHELMHSLLNIEEKMGRIRTSVEQYSDRIIDLDILLFNEDIILEEGLIIPHPRVHLRRFALVPSAEIAGSWVHRKMNKTVDELLVECKDDGNVELINDM